MNNVRDPERQERKYDVNMSQLYELGPTGYGFYMRMEAVVV
jgi:hypothetical protein